MRRSSLPLNPPTRPSRAPAPRWLDLALTCVLVAGLAVTGACQRHTASPAGAVRLRVGYTSTTVDIGDLPSLIAARTLAGQGYVVESTFFAQPELAVAALVRGDMDIVNGGTRAFWAADARGADLVLIADHADKGYEIAAVSDIKRCEDLNGRALAMSSRGALPTALGEAYLQRCPAARPRVLIMPSSTDRLAALAAGAVDAAIVQHADMARLEQLAPGRFHALEPLRSLFPGLILEGVFVSRRFLDAHRPAVVDYVRARIAANRQALATPDVLLDEARHWPAVGAIDRAAIASELLEAPWSKDAGFTRDAVAATIAFFVRTGSLAQPIAVDEAADASVIADAQRAGGGLP